MSKVTGSVSGNTGSLSFISVTSIKISIGAADPVAATAKRAMVLSSSNSLLMDWIVLSSPVLPFNSKKLFGVDNLKNKLKLTKIKLAIY